MRLRRVAVSVYGPTILVAVGQGAILPLVALSARELGASVGTAALIVALIGAWAIDCRSPCGCAGCPNRGATSPDRGLRR